MKKKKSAYKEALKKHTPEEVLNMYRDSKLDLNKKEWDDIHKRIEINNNRYFGFKLESFMAVVICLLAILVVSIFANVDNHEKIKKCNEIKGHTCTRYEIESMTEDGNNNR